MPDSASPSDSNAPRPPLSRDSVVEAAVELADASGIAALSMRKLAAALRVEAMSLYNHVANKEDLLDGMVEFVVAQIEPPPAGVHWKSAMRIRATSAHEALSRHPWAAMLLMSRVNVGPHMLRYVDATIGCLRAAGFSWALADHAWNLVDSHVYGFTLQQLNLPFAAEEYSEVAADFLDQIPVEVFPNLHGMAREVIEKRHDGVQHFEFGLELVLDGLERLLAGAR